MNPNPFNTLLHSRKAIVAFLTALADVVLYFSDKYLPASPAQDIHFLIGVLTVLGGVLITTIAWEDNAERNKVAAMSWDTVYSERNQAAKK